MSDSDKQQNTQCMISSNNTRLILLATARIILITEDGNKIKARALLDPGSQTSFVTPNIIKQPRLKSCRTNIQVSGIGNSTTQINQMVKIIIQCKDGTSDKMKVSCSVLNKITSSLPQIVINEKCLNIPRNLPLADKEFFIPSQTDVLLGAYLYYDIIEPGIVKLGQNLPVLQNRLGWIIGGPIPLQEHLVSNISISLFCQSPDINELIPKFWHNAANMGQ